MTNTRKILNTVDTNPVHGTAVTVLMSCYNCSATVGSAIESILAQTHRQFRFLIYDDASTDGTADLLRSYDDPRIELRILSKNRGLSRNLHEGVAEAETPYIARIDADDIAFPERLAEQLAFMELNPEVDVLGTNVLFFNGEGQDVLGRQPENHQEIAIALFFGFTMLHPTIMLRRAALLEAELNYNPRFRYSQDFDLWSRMIPEHKFANLQKPLMRLRDHPGRISRARRGKQQRFTTLIRARQIRRILPDAKCHDVKAFSAAARGDVPEGQEGLKRLEAILIRMMDGNRAMRAFQIEAFNRAAAAFFEGICRQMLLAGKLAGAGYLTSPLRKYAAAKTMKSKIKFLGLCGLAVLQGERKT